MTENELVDYLFDKITNPGTGVACWDADEIILWTVQELKKLGWHANAES